MVQSQQLQAYCPQQYPRMGAVMDLFVHTRVDPKPHGPVLKSRSSQHNRLSRSPTTSRALRFWHARIQRSVSETMSRSILLTSKDRKVRNAHSRLLPSADITC